MVHSSKNNFLAILPRFRQDFSPVKSSSINTIDEDFYAHFSYI